MLGSASDHAALRLELRQASASYQKSGGYRGLSVRVPDVGAVAEAAVANGGTVVSAASVVEHGASSEPPRSRNASVV